MRFTGRTMADKESQWYRRVDGTPRADSGIVEFFAIHRRMHKSWSTNRLRFRPGGPIHPLPGSVRPRFQIIRAKKGLKGRNKSADMDRCGRLCRASGQRCEVFFAASHCDLTRNGFHNIAWGRCAAAHPRIFRIEDSEP